MKTINVLMLMALSLPLNSNAQSDGSSQQIYDAMQSAMSMYNMETANGQCPTNDRSGFWGLCVTENSENEFRYREVLRVRADSGEPVAAFYWGVLMSNSAVGHGNSEIGIRARKQGYDMAITYYRKACPVVSEACWNIADIYAKGLGGTKSGLAAAEWFYKAGISYLKNDQREEALAALESIQEIDKAHPLGKKLDLRIQIGAPR